MDESISKWRPGSVGASKLRSQKAVAGAGRGIRVIRVIKGD